MQNAIDFSAYSAPSQIAHYSTWAEEYGTSSMVGDAKIATDESGRIVQAEYANGSSVIRHSSYVVVKTDIGQHWFGTDKGQWYTFD